MCVELNGFDKKIIVLEEYLNFQLHVSSLFSCNCSMLEEEEEEMELLVSMSVYWQMRLVGEVQSFCSRITSKTSNNWAFATTFCHLLI